MEDLGTILHSVDSSTKMMMKNVIPISKYASYDKYKVF